MMTAHDVGVKVRSCPCIWYEITVLPLGEKGNDIKGDVRYSWFTASVVLVVLLLLFSEHSRDTCDCYSAVGTTCVSPELLSSCQSRTFVLNTSWSDERLTGSQSSSNNCQGWEKALQNPAILRKYFYNK